MMRSVALLCLFGLLVSLGRADEVAVAVLSGTSNDADAAGVFTFTTINDTNVTITYTVSGFTEGDHAVHIHTYGDITAADGTGAGGHWNPTGADHGCSPSADRHMGDLFTLTAASDGTASGTVVRDLVKLTGGHSVLGRSVVIHQLADSCTGTSGDAGTRHAQGVIGLENTASNLSNNTASAAYLVAQLSGTDGNSGISGTVYFEPKDTGAVRVYVKITGLTASNVHGLHIHEFGDLDSTDGTSAGGHYNPDGVNHGLPSDAAHHDGDLGNFVVQSDGAIYGDMEFTGITWNDIIGRGVVLHADADHGSTSQSSGAAGSRLSFGAIGITDTWPTVETSPDAATTTVAVATMSGTSNDEDAAGTVTFTTLGNQMQIDWSLTGLTEGDHALHIHTYGDITAADGTGAGGHYNPHGADHSCFSTGGSDRHVGDVVDVTAAADGTSSGTVVRDLVMLTGGNSVLGRSVVIHASADSCTGTSGDAGVRHAQGVIGLENTADNLAANAATDESILVAKLTATAGTDSVSGTVWLTMDGDTTYVYADFTGPTADAEHGLHIHEFGDWSNTDATSAGGHYDPAGVAHALPGENATRHVGDLGNFAAGQGTSKLLALTSGGVSVALNTLAGRGIVLHASADQGAASQPSGGAGSRLALGVLGWTNTFGGPALDVKISPTTLDGPGDVSFDSPGANHICYTLDGFAPVCSDDGCTTGTMAANRGTVSLTAAVEVQVIGCNSAGDSLVTTLSFDWVVAAASHASMMITVLFSCMLSSMLFSRFSF